MGTRNFSRLRAAAEPIGFVEYAAAIAHKSGATLTLIHVCERPDAMTGIVPRADNEADDANDRALGQKALENLRVETGKHTNVGVRVIVVDGSPVREIISASKAVQMVVMGTHGRTGLRRALTGSVAEAVVRGASCPVLTIHLPCPVVARVEPLSPRAER
jgi:nucleotide-binding universal stress UspA family protein